jgi:6-phosphogluconate dehydrogenase (decarboxylating)
MKTKNPIMIEAGKKAAATRKKNAESNAKKVRSIERYVSKLSPVKKAIGLELIAGKKPENIVKRMSKGRSSTTNAQAYVTMVLNGIEKIIKK